jgi:cytochrome c oxidase subunit II
VTEPTGKGYRAGKASSFAGSYSYPVHKIKRTTLALSALFITISLSSCGRKNISGLGYEPNLSSVNDTSLSLWQGAWIAAAVVGAFTLALILWPAIRHRRKGDAFPKQTQYNITTEIAYTIIPFIIVAVLFYFTVKDQSIITKVDAAQPAPHKIHVNGMQWSWQFTYEDKGENATVTGTPAEPPVLVLPKGEAVDFTITSSDVVHGFWIPAFMIQMQNLPGVENHLRFTANKIGTYPGRCNILCGRSHSQMLFKVKVVSPQDYKSYLGTLGA